MGFLYKNDFGKSPNCGIAAEFYPLEQACHCIDDDNIRLDPITNACSCISGYKWDEEKQMCLSQLCPVGQFMSQKNGCIDCSTPGAISISGNEEHIDSCTQCGNREYLEYVSGTHRCYLKTNPLCVSGTSIRDVNGLCKSCNDSTESFHLGYQNEEGYAQCNACPNRYMVKSACTLRNMCEKGSEFPAYFPNGGIVKCYSCSDPKDYDVGELAYDQAYCTACQNDAGIANRELIGTTCRKKVCDSDEFLGADGLCYKCDQPESVKVNTTGSGCDSSICGRELVGNRCQKKCPTDGFHIQTSEGACYDCRSETYFLASKDECASCTPKRDWYGTTQSKATCFLNSLITPNETYGVSLRWDHNVSVTKCSVYSFLGYNSNLVSDIATQHCENCIGNHVMGNLCVSDSYCTVGMQFRSPSDSRNLCINCTETVAKEIGTHEKEREMCFKCTTAKRFVAGSSCYPCDSGDEPSVFGEDEEKGCLDCGNRIIQDGKCIRPR